MNESKISVRYAKAFFTAAVERKILEVVKRDVDLLLQLLQSQPRLKELLASPVVHTGEKRNFMIAIFKEHFNRLTMDFLDLLLKNNREIYLVEMCLNFQGLYGRLTGIISAQLVTATPMDDDLLKEFNQLIQVNFGSKAEVIAKVDEKLLGGFILRVDDLQIDTSVATQLKKMKRELVSFTKK